MKNKTWSDIAEVVGIVSIVAGLILVAWEIRQANKIARAQMVMDIAAQANQFTSATFSSPVVADMAAAIADPSRYELSETQESMATATAWFFMNIFWSAQRAHDNGLLGDDDIFMYQSSLAWHLENHPGLIPAFRDVYRTAPWVRDMYVFQPLVELVEREGPEPKAED